MFRVGEVKLVWTLKAEAVVIKEKWNTEAVKRERKTFLLILLCKLPAHEVGCQHFLINNYAS